MPASTPADPSAQRTGDAVIRVAREAYGRLVAYLAARSGDIAACEDALSAAFLSALETWPARGVPERPEAWLLAAARNRLRDQHRRRKVRDDGQATLITLMEEAVALSDSPSSPFPDERLKLMFVCAHPAIDATMHTPLMLQTVLGLSGDRIASAFLVGPAAMGQRLSRVKGKIRDARIAFEVPERAEWTARLPPLLAAIYAAYGLGWSDYAGDDGGASGGFNLADEALELGFALRGLIGLEPELNGLLALILYCESRKAARMTRDGAYVPLSDQDTALWDREMIGLANQLLNAAQPLRRFGRFQLEAAIQAVHARRMVDGAVVWDEIVILYEGLLRYAPSLAAHVGHAAALIEAGQAQAGLTALDNLDAARLATYQPYWAARAHVLHRLGRTGEAAIAYDRAIGLARHDGQRVFLQGRKALL